MAMNLTAEEARRIFDYNPESNMDTTQITGKTDPYERTLARH
jgi:hypothetical protein